MPKHVCLVLRENLWLLSHFQVSGACCLACSQEQDIPYPTSNPTNPSSCPDALHFTSGLTISCMDYCIASCIVSLVQALLPSVHCFEHANGILFSTTKNVNPPNYQRMTYIIPRSYSALSSASVPYFIFQATSQSVPIPPHPTHFSYCSSNADTKKPSLTAPGRPRYPPHWLPAFWAYLHYNLGLLYALYCVQVSLIPPCWTLNSFRGMTVAFHLCESAFGSAPGTWKTLSQRLLSDLIPLSGRSVKAWAAPCLHPKIVADTE